MDIEAVLQKYETELMSLVNVQGVGLGEQAGKPVIKVFVNAKVSESSLPPDQIVPKNLEGCDVHVEEIGIITA